MIDYFLNSDDYTYIYGDLMFKCEYCKTSNTYIEPFIRKENNKIIKFYKEKKCFIIYENNELTEIIKVMTCWSDDYIAYKIKDNIAYSYNEVYHGREYKKDELCNIDFNEFISKL